MKNKVTTLNDLIYDLKSCTNINDYLALVKRINLKKEDIVELCIFNEDKYTRNCAIKTNEFELIALCWNPGQKTPIHCHNKQECWMYVVEGEIFEEVFTFQNHKFKKVRESKITSNKFAFINDLVGVHRISNNTQKKAISLHLYAAPIENCNQYDENTGKAKLALLKYDNVIKCVND